MQEYVRKVKAEDAKKNQKKKKGSISKAEDNLTEDSSKKKKKKILNVADRFPGESFAAFSRRVNRATQRELTRLRQVFLFNHHRLLAALIHTPGLCGRRR